ncbi:protein LplB [Spirochaetia bacterium]|nr:protein LplB [Spirochaetia bacterium]
MVYLQRSWQYYVMLIPVVLYYLIFHFGAYPGLLMAFQDFRASRGLFGSTFVGFKHFKVIFGTSSFYTILGNTLTLNLMNLVIYFPAPIILAILLNEVRHNNFKRLSQSLMYLPHFFSWVVLGGMVIQILSPSKGIVNMIISSLSGGHTIYFMASKSWWRFVFVLSSIWKEVGWGTIIYLAAIAGIDSELYEAAAIDGANHFQQIFHVTLPGMATTIFIMLILRMGSVLNVGMEQIMMLQNAAVNEIADVIQTYTYRMGVQQGRYSMTTAIGIFQSVVGMILILTANWTSKKFTETSII